MGGVNTYTFGLLDELIPMGHEHQITIFCTRANEFLFQKYLSSNHVQIKILKLGTIRRFLDRMALVIFNQQIYSKMQNWLFRSMANAMDDCVDVIYIPTAVLFPLGNRKPTVHSMHDIQHVHYPEFFSFPTNLYRNTAYPLSAVNADITQASSEFIKADFIANLPGLEESNVVVIPEGVNIQMFRTPEKSTLAEYKLPDKFLFYPGQLWLHKNHITVLKALRKLRDDYGLNVPLVMTGARYSASESIFKYLKEHSLDQVFYLGKVPFDDILGLYHQATFLITAVLYESSSLPILEAAAAGTPIIASRTKPNIELSERLSINLFEALDYDDLAMVLLDVWEDDSLQERQSDQNSSAIEYYSWKSAAVRYCRLFEGM